MRWLKIVTVAALLVACRPKPAAPAAAIDASVPVQGAGVPDAMVRQTAVDGAVDEGTMTCAPFADRMAAGRKATLEKRYDDALAAFDDAQYSVPFDGQAWAERGYTKVLAGRPLQAIADLRFAVVVAEASTLPNVHFNLGLAYERAADGTMTESEAESLGPMHGRAALLERARAHFAAASQLGNPAATARLGKRSHCPSARFTADLDPPHIASSWRDVAKIVEPSEASSARTETAARRLVCAGLNLETHERDPKHDVCGIPAVGKEIVINDAYSNYHTLRTHLLPLDGGRFFVDSDFTSGGACRGGIAEYRVTLRDGIIEVDVTEDDVRRVDQGRRAGAPFWSDLNVEQEKTCPNLAKAKSDGDLNCAVGAMTSKRFYEARTGKALRWIEPVLASDDPDCADAATESRQ